MIDAILDQVTVEDDDEEKRFNVSAFRNMRARMELWDPSPKQAVWIRAIYEKVVGAPQYENLVSNGAVPRGREVPTPDVLRPENLPKRPPGRR